MCPLAQEARVLQDAGRIEVPFVTLRDGRIFVVLSLSEHLLCRRRPAPFVVA